MKHDDTEPPFSLPKTMPKWVIYGFFVLGLFSAVCFRILIVFKYTHTAWFRPVWYAGIFGYVAFFLYRYLISRKRKNAITRFRLMEKLRSDAPISPTDRQVLAYLVGSIDKSLENFNYLFIFAMSLVAIGLDIFLSLSFSAG